MKPTNANLYAHYKAVADSVNIPIVLYNIPKATGCPLDPELVDQLADIENIKAIKDSSGELERIQAYADIAKRKDFELLIGSDSKISYAYGLGATAAVAGTSNVIVDTLVSLDRALRAGESEKAEKLQKDIDVLRGETWHCTERNETFSGTCRHCRSRTGPHASTGTVKRR